MTLATPRFGALLLLALGLAASHPASAQIRIEAESGTVSDPNTTDTDPGAEVRTSDSNVSGTFTGAGFVALQKGALTLSLSSVPAGEYTLSVVYASPFDGTKYEYVDVGGVRYGNSAECTESFGFPQVATWTSLSLTDAASPTVTVPAGASTLVISACYGYTYFDSVTLTPTAPPTPAEFVFEAESAAFSDPTTTDTEPGAEARDASRLEESRLTGPVSGTGFAALQKGAITFDISAVPAGEYTLTLAYASPDAGVRYDNVVVDGTGVGNAPDCTNSAGPGLGLAQATMFTNLVVPNATGGTTVMVDGTPGTITITACYGYSYFDYIRLTPVGETASEPTTINQLGFELRQNAPNPFGASTEIPYTLAESAHVRLDVYDVTGRRVASLVDEVQQAGPHTVRFDASGLVSGVYVYRLQTPAGVQMKRMVQVR